MKTQDPETRPCINSLTSLKPGGPGAHRASTRVSSRLRSRLMRSGNSVLGLPVRRVAWHLKLTAPKSHHDRPRHEKGRRHSRRREGRLGSPATSGRNQRRVRARLAQGTVCEFCLEDVQRSETRPVERGTVTGHVRSTAPEGPESRLEKDSRGRTGEQDLWESATGPVKSRQRTDGT